MVRIAIHLLCLATVAGAAEIQFEASVDRTRSGQAEPIRLTLRIVSDENLGHVPAPGISLKDFYVEGPSVSTRMDMVNFSTSFTRELVYILYAKRTGKIRIGPARLAMGGETYQTKVIEVEVIKGSSRRGPKSATRSGASGEFRLEENLFVLGRTDRKRAYVGQQITVDYDLFYRFRLHNVGFKEIPTFAGFWVKELFVAQQLQSHREVLEGVSYNVAPLRRVALFPTSAGTYDIGVLAISCDIPQQRGRRGGLLDDFFSGDPFFGRSQSVLLQSEAVQVEVMSLPQAGRPSDFAGAVGRFQLSAKAQPTHVAAGDPVTLRVLIEGQGNLAAVQAPGIQGVEGIKVYDPKLKEEEQIANGIYGGRRLFEYILIPEQGGMMEIPPVRFAYFDPHEAAYQVLESGPIFIHSQGSVEEAAPADYGLSRKDIEAVGQDIRHIKPDVEELGGEVAIHRSGLFWIFQGALPVLFSALLFYQRHQRRLQGDVAYARQRRARSEAGRRLERADALLAAGDSAPFHGEVQAAVLEFIADRLNLAAAGLTSETCAEILEAHSVDQETVEALRDLLVRCDYARFAPTAASPADMAEARRLSGDLVERLERQI
jgi:hypothetical protein